MSLGEIFNICNPAGMCAMYSSQVVREVYTGIS